jgi:hypothetical protein
MLAIAVAMRIRVQHFYVTPLKDQLIPFAGVEVESWKCRRLAKLWVRDEGDDLGLKTEASSATATFLLQT